MAIITERRVVPTVLPNKRPLICCVVSYNDTNDKLSISTARCNEGHAQVRYDVENLLNTDVGGYLSHIPKEMEILVLECLLAIAKYVPRNIFI